MNDPRERRVAAQARDDNVQRAPAIDRPAEHIVAGTLFDRQGFPSHGRLVHVARAPHHPPVERELVSRTHEHRVAYSHIVDGHADVAPFTPDDGFGRREIHQRADGAAGAIHRARLEQLRQGEQKYDGRGFGPFSERDCARHGDQHQDVDVEHAGANREQRAARGEHAAEDNRQAERYPERETGGAEERARHARRERDA